MLLKERLDPRANDGMSVLRHRWEEMVLNLVVEVAHPPINPLEGTRRHIHGVDS